MSKTRRCTRLEGKLIQAQNIRRGKQAEKEKSLGFIKQWITPMIWCFLTIICYGVHMYNTGSSPSRDTFKTELIQIATVSKGYSKSV